MARSRSPLSSARATAVAARLDVRLDCGICLACLSFVAFAIDGGDEQEVARQARQMTPDIWEEGLAEPALAAAAKAARGGVTDAAIALADLEQRGGRSQVARALVRRLAEQLSDQVHADVRREERLRRGGPGGRPELN